MRQPWAVWSSTRRRRLIGLAALVCTLVLGPLACGPLTGAAYAARNLPKDARYGKLTEFSYPYAKIAGKVLHMSPGAKIYNEQNLIILPVAMRAPARVLFRLDNAGELSAIWILTAQEAAAYDRAPFKTKPLPAPAASPGSSSAKPLPSAAKPGPPAATPVPPVQAPPDSRLGGRQ